MASDPAERWEELKVGLMLLTRLPVGLVREEAPSVAASAWSWPLAGLAVGGLAAFVYWLATALGLTGPLAATLAVLATVLATGGLHEDGLADLADGFGGGRDKTRVLEIMRDSRIGSYGTLAIGFSLLIRVLAIGALSRWDAVWGFLAIAAASRAVMPAALHLMPPARSDGLGSGASGVTQEAALAAALTGCACLLPFGLIDAALVAAAMAAAAFWVGRRAMSRIGGQTGDVCGAMQQVAEGTGWLALVALQGTLG
ncbi:adenosylcobinamide-GDP ribazoletransferase [Frigidibacter sp. RF13]|uniref:adenosylcobinamide-GDP ribazoletransferase n=1 Tax=Frigidibacter sp. RF13 TaxID=2997340 RepID=UPI002270B84A|nr:adenosylcobinamide-GDP ribazoletransferase [Frigidibacter sp. RF13]MCY1126629.1 adenosylcobinamide-GDP ribazoletransferase [Frigidibacter sp. RF13]